MKREIKIDINKSWAKKVKKGDFIKNLEKAYPDSDLAAIYDDLQPKKKDTAEKQPG